MFRNLLILLLPFFIFSCNTQNENELIIESFVELAEIPSASGVEVVDSEIWMVGDDSPYLFQYDKELNLIEKFKISEADSMVNNRVLKTIKADFESIARKGDSLLILGSGSVKNTRDTLVIFSLNQKNVINKINIRSIFDKYKLIGKADTEVNFEGLAISSNKIYFFNRGNISDQNDVLIISIDQFDSFLNKKVISDKTIQNFKLPQINDFTSGFSGACLSEDEKYLYFTSSVEATTDVYHDGEVLGSFIGRIELESNEIKFWPLKENNEFVITKLESISIMENTEEFIKFVCTSDNDDGTSGVYQIKLNLK